MSEFIDITLPLDVHLPTWPGSPRFELVQVASLEVDGCNETRLSMGSHSGTHMDAPKHFVMDGASIDQLPLETLVGTAWVVDVGNVTAVTADVLAKLDLPDTLERLLFKTTNSLWWAVGEHSFQEDFVALTLDGVDWLVRKGVRLVGIDYLSIQRFRDANVTHETLLGAGVVVVEGINLAEVEPGVYELFCLPLRIVGAEGAPARAVLKKIPFIE